MASLGQQLDRALRSGDYQRYNEIVEAQRWEWELRRQRPWWGQYNYLGVGWMLNPAITWAFGGNPFHWLTLSFCALGTMGVTGWIVWRIRLRKLRRLAALSRLVGVQP